MSLLLMSATFAAMMLINLQAVEALKSSNDVMRHINNLSQFRAQLRREEYADSVSHITYPATNRATPTRKVQQRTLVINGTEYSLPVLGMRRRP